MKFAFHERSAAQPRSRPLRKYWIALASVHPLMTFVPGVNPSLAGVPFALEGEAAATRIARRIVRDLGGDSFALPASRKGAYHAWATFSSPLLLAFLVTLEEAARCRRTHARGFAPQKSADHPPDSGAELLAPRPPPLSSGPIIRETWPPGRSTWPGRHPRARATHLALAQSALRRLPVKNRNGLRRMLQN